VYTLPSLWQWKRIHGEENIVLLTCENVKKMQMKKEIQFIFEGDAMDEETNEDEDDDSLKILFFSLILVVCLSTVVLLFFTSFYLLLDGLRSNGRLNNFINTPIKKGRLKKKN
jgi:hypothetical protein